MEWTWFEIKTTSESKLYCARNESLKICKLSTNTNVPISASSESLETSKKKSDFLIKADNEIYRARDDFFAEQAWCIFNVIF